MKRVVIACASSSLNNVSRSEDIIVLPMHVVINGEKFVDGVEIFFDDFVKTLKQDNYKSLETLPPSIEDVGILFRSLVAENYTEVFIVTPSKKMSAAYENILAAAELFEDLIDIHVFNTKSISYMEAVLALEASKLVKKGLDSIGIIRELKKMRDRQANWFVMDDLSQMVKSKRISASKGFIGNMLQIKPILSFDKDGVIQPLEQVRGTDKAVDRLCQYALNNINARPGSLFIVNNGSQQLVDKVTTILEANNMFNVPVIPNACVNITHLGTEGVSIGAVYFA